MKLTEQQIKDYAMEKKLPYKTAKWELQFRNSKGPKSKILVEIMDKYNCDIHRARYIKYVLDSGKEYKPYNPRKR